MINNNLTVVYITDERYVFGTAASIQSLKESQKDSIVEVYVVSVGLKRTQIIKFEEMSGDNFFVKVLEAPPQEFENDAVETYVSTAALFKFSLPEIFKDKERVLYLDGDILISKPIQSFFCSDFDNRYAYVVRDLVAELFHNHERLGLEYYFNSGVMLLNLALMREHKISNKLRNQKKKDPGKFMDQDTFNTVFNQNVVYADGRYNLMVPNFRLFGLTIFDINKFYGWCFSSFEELEEETSIFHLTNWEKPWTHEDTFKSKEWLNYFRKTPFYSSPLKLKRSILYNKDYPVILEERYSFRNVEINRNYYMQKEDLELKYRGKEIILSSERIDKINKYLDLINKEIVVIINSNKENISGLEDLLKSIFFQSVSCDRCILLLDGKDFPNEEKDLTQRLLKYKDLGVNFFWKKDDDFCFQKICNLIKKTNSIFILLSNLESYNKDLFKNLILCHLKFPNSVITSGRSCTLYPSLITILQKFINSVDNNNVKSKELNYLLEIFRKARKVNKDLYEKSLEIDLDSGLAKQSKCFKQEINTRKVMSKSSCLKEVTFPVICLDEFTKRQSNRDIDRIDYLPRQLHFLRSVVNNLSVLRFIFSSSNIASFFDSDKKEISDCDRKYFSNLFGENVAIESAKIINFNNYNLPYFVNTISGMSIIENWGRWSDRNISENVDIFFKDILPNNFKLIFKVRSLLPKNSIKIIIGKQTHIITITDKDTIFNISIGLNGELVQKISFTAFFNAKPSEVRDSKDNRLVGIGFSWLKILKEKQITIL